MPYTAYRKSISNELLELSRRFRLFLPNQHFPGDGRYKENILKSIIEKFMPYGHLWQQDS